MEGRDDHRNSLRQFVDEELGFVVVARGEPFDLAAAVFGRCPPAWLVSVPAEDFCLRERFSTTALRGAADALVRVAALTDADGQCPIALSQASFHRDRRAGEHESG